jgi:HSP20 family protein
LTWIKVQVFGLDEDRTLLNSNAERPMADTPVEVKKTAPAKTPDAWHSFRDEMNRLFDRFSGGFGMPMLRRMFDAEPTGTYETSFSFPTPAVDVTEDEKAYKITAELPGLAEKDISVAVSGDMLTIKGEKSYEKEEKNKDRHVSERAYGSFQRSFTVPDGVDRDKIAADLAKGVLTITLPKTAQAQKQQKIEVKAAA